MLMLRRPPLAALFVLIVMLADPALAAGSKKPASKSPAPAPVVSTPISQSPVLATGEVYVPLVSGCGVVMGASPLKTDAKAATPELEAMYKKLYGGYTWTGACHDGLADGEGSFEKEPVVVDSATITTTSYFAYGRKLDHTVTTTKYKLPGAPQDVKDELMARGEMVIFQNLTDLNTVTWATIIGASQISVFGTDNKASFAYAYQAQCSGDDDIFHGCTPLAERDGYGYVKYGDAYGVRLVTPQTPDGVITPCPDVNTATGCVYTWRSIIAPLGTEGMRIRANYLADRDALREKLKELNAPREKILADAEAAKTAADTAAQARKDKAFTDKLKTANAGQLFAMADELRQSGDSDKARQALRALVSRFPNSPLAGVAAEQMAQ